MRQQFFVFAGCQMAGKMNFQVVTWANYLVPNALPTV